MGHPAGHPGRLAAVVGGGFGVDEKAVDLGGVELERAFERGDDGVDAGHGEIVGQGAVAGDLDVVGFGCDSAEAWRETVRPSCRGRGPRRVTKTSWMSRISGKAAATRRRRSSRSRSRSREAGRSMVAGSLSMWVRMEAMAGTSLAHLGFECGDELVGFAQRHGLVDFEVLLDVQAVVELLDADLVDGEVAAGGDGADAVVDALGDGGGGDGVDDDVGAGEMALHGLGGGHGELLGALEGEVAGHAERDVGEVVGAGAAGAQAIDGEDAGDGGEVVDEVLAELVLGLRLVAGGVGGGGGVEQGVDGLAGEPPTDAQDDAGDGDGGDGVGVLEPGEGEALAGVGGGEAEHDGERGPHVGGEVDGVGGEGVGAMLAGDAAEGAGAGEVDGDGEEQDGERPERRA